MKLSEEVEHELGEAVKAWADENLPSKPALLANMICLLLKAELLKKVKEIEEIFNQISEAE